VTARWEGQGDGIPDATDDALEDGADALELPLWELVERGAAPPAGWPNTPTGRPYESVDYWRRELAWAEHDGPAYATVAVSGEGSQALPMCMHVGLSVSGSPSMELVSSAIDRFTMEGTLMQTLYLSGLAPTGVCPLAQIGVATASPAAFRWELAGPGLLS
jgi:hypothetical protein